MVFKQLTRQILQNKLFVILLVLLTALTTLSFFFVLLTIDGNADRVTEITAAGKDMVRYQAALESNTILAYTFFASMTGLTAFVFFIFFFRFFRAGRKQIGCLKAIGFCDSTLRCCFLIFTVTLSLVGGLIGLGLAYPLSDILLAANRETYGVTGLVKFLQGKSIIFGLLTSTISFCCVSFLSYKFVEKKEPGSLIAGYQYKTRFSAALRIADSAANRLPVKNKLAVRITLRKPFAVCLLLVAVMSFSVCMIIAYSINISSSKIMASQTEGHHYEYVTYYDNVIKKESLPDNSLGMLHFPSSFEYDNTTIQHTISGVYQLNALYELRDTNGSLITPPSPGTAVIGPSLQEIYGIMPGDVLYINIFGEMLQVTVNHIAVNAQSATLYVNGSELSALAERSDGDYNVLFSGYYPNGTPGKTFSRQERVYLLERDAVSNKTSGVINQVIGVLIGCILFFLALYINFQDNVRDILILHMMGFGNRSIQKMLVDIYRPLILILFFITLPPSIFMVQYIQKQLSITTGDYMPFGTNIFVILLALIILLLIYQLVQWVFYSAVKRTVNREEIAEYTSAE